MRLVEKKEYIHPIDMAKNLAIDAGKIIVPGLWLVHANIKPLFFFVHIPAVVTTIYLLFLSIVATVSYRNMEPEEKGRPKLWMVAGCWLLFIFFSIITIMLQLEQN